MFHPAMVHPEPEKHFKYKNSSNGLASGNLLTSSVGVSAILLLFLGQPLP